MATCVSIPAPSLSGNALRCPSQTSHRNKIPYAQNSWQWRSQASYLARRVPCWTHRTRVCVCASFSDRNAKHPKYPDIHPVHPWTNIFEPVDDRPFWVQMLDNLSKVTALMAVKYATIGAFGLIFGSWMLSVILDPVIWMYVTWFLVIWPWPVAIMSGIAALVSTYRAYHKKANQYEQFFVLLTALAWLILVPLAHHHGYVDGYPLILYFTYLLFFLITPSLRKKMYLSLDPGPEEKDWVTTPSWPIKALYVTAVVIGHWLAAKEAPVLITTWNFAWQTKLAGAMIFFAFILQYYGTYFLAKYSKKLRMPYAVVIFGPYRFLRHPIYSSYMFLFTGFCFLLRSYWSLAVLIPACLLYYEQRIKIEEDLLLKHYPEVWVDYAKKVRHKFVPFVY